MADLQISFREFRISLSGRVGLTPICIDAQDIAPELSKVRIPIARYLGPETLFARMHQDQTVTIWRRSVSVLMARQRGRLSVTNPQQLVPFEMDIATRTLI